MLLFFGCALIRGEGDALLSSPLFSPVRELGNLPTLKGDFGKEGADRQTDALTD